MAWPSIADFSNAVLNPIASFDDPQLKRGQPALDRSGRALGYTGSFARVYQVRSGGRDFAVRCFTSEVRDHQRRYNQLSQYLRSVNPPGFVEFDYQPRGIRSLGEWYPIVKMDWVNGQTLDEFVENNLRDSNTLKRISDKWREIAIELQRRDIAHNDLQHGNVIVQQGGPIWLVDYDGIFLPEFRGSDSPEIGHQNFQHPLRTGKDYAQHVDNFPALVIYLSLLAVAADPGLWDRNRRFNNGDNLILKKSDFQCPATSECFRALKNSPSDDVRNLAQKLETFCSRPVADVPTLQSILQSGRTAKPKAALSPYQKLIQERQQKDKSKIDCQDFIQFCISMDGQEMRTLRQGTRFRIKVNQSASILYFTPTTSGKARTCPQTEVERFLNHFEETQSQSTRDYQRPITNNASYLIAVLNRYLHNTPSAPTVRPTKAAGSLTEIPETGHEKADAYRELQTAQSELQTVQRQATEAKAKADKELQAEQAARRKAEADKDKAETQLQAEQAARRKAEADKDKAETQLQLKQIAWRKAEADKAQALSWAQQMRAELQTTRAELQTTRAKLEKYSNSWFGGKLKR